MASGQLDSLATIEHNLRRKQAILRALKQRAEARPGRARYDEEQHLALLEEEVSSLECGLAGELVTLLSPERRNERLANQLAFLSTATSPLNDCPSTAEEQHAVLFTPVNQLPPQQHGDVDPDTAWLAYREAQHARDREVRSKLVCNWHAHNAELAELKRVSTRIESHLSMRRPSEHIGASKESLAIDRNQRRKNDMSTTSEHSLASRSFATLAARATSRTPEQTALAVEQRRQDQRMLLHEVREQRQRNWAKQNAELRRIRLEGCKRVDDVLERTSKGSGTPDTVSVRTSPLAQQDAWCSALVRSAYSTAAIGKVRSCALPPRPHEGRFAVTKFGESRVEARERTDKIPCGFSPLQYIM